MGKTPMKISEMPSKVMLISKSLDSISYRFACDCISKEHDVHIDFELDKELGIMTLFFYKKMWYADWWYHKNWIGRMVRRVRGCFRLLFIGEIEIEGDIVISGEAHINSLIRLLEDGKEYLVKETR